MASSTKYGVGEAIDKLGFGKFQLLLSGTIGFANVADAMEMMILSILSPALHCHWHITHWEQALLTTVVFLGMMMSSLFWGTVADKHGRRIILILCSFFLFYFGLLTSIAPSFYWVLFLRFLVGVFIGGMPQGTTLYVEYLPTSTRGQSVVILSFFWAIGSCFEALLAWAVMPTLGWRYLVGFSALPLLVFVSFSKFIPESPMFLAASGRHSEVVEQLDKVAKLNEKPSIVGSLDLDSTPTQGPRGQFSDLFKSGRTRLTLSLFFLWFVCASTYYGVVLMSTEILNSSRSACKATSLNIEEDGILEEEECSVHVCRGLLEADYVKLIWTTFAEFPGTILCMLLIDRYGRKLTMVVLSTLFAIFTAIIAECGASQAVLVIALFGSRACTSGLFNTVYVYTPEVYPTQMRALALGFGSASARVGAMITPYIAQVLLRWSFYSAIAVYVCLGAGAAVVAYLLPIETKGQDLTQSKPVKPITPMRSTVQKQSELVENMEENEIEQRQENNK